MRRIHFCKMILLAIACFSALAACSDATEGVASNGSVGDGSGGGGGGGGGGVGGVDPVVITSPVGTYVSNSGSVTITGTCTANATVVIVGDTLVYGPCTNNGFTFTIAKSVDRASYKFSVYQGFSSSRYSASVDVLWTRDTVAPSPPRIDDPTSGQSSASGNSITISGGESPSASCEDGATISMSGAASGTTTCSGGAYSFSPSASVDGTYVYHLAQTDTAGNQSQSIDVTWTRVSFVPAVTVISPAMSGNAYSSAGDFQLTLGCVTGADVTVAKDGSTDQVSTCDVSGQMTYPVSSTMSGAHVIAIVQSLGGTSSAAVTINWSLDSSVPTTPVVTTPYDGGKNIYSNSSPVTIDGTCTAGNIVSLHVASPASTQTTTCTGGGTFTFNVSEAADASYNISIWQTNGVATDSGVETVYWVRDTSAPSAVTVSSHDSPYVAGGSSVVISGACETNATVSLSGGATASATCVALAYSFTVVKSSDGTFDFTIGQTDRAGNSSSTISWSWVRDTSAPSAVTVSSHSSPYLSNGSSVVIGGACETNATVSISGSLNSTQTCAGGTYSFTSSQSSDGTYSYTLSQADSAGNVSPTTAFSWQRDAAAPSAPTITNPAASPYISSGSTFTISGGCESGATVALAGDGSASTTCVAGAYTLTNNKGVDATYNYTVSQTDAAGNTSSSVAQQWVRSSAIPATPTITSPSLNPYASNGSSITISGGCTSGYTVSLSGGATGSVTCASGSFSISVSKSSDGTYSINVKQTSLSNVDSANATVTWIRDTAAPGAPTITAPSANPNYSNGNSLTVSGVCESGATVSISGDIAASGMCMGGAYSLTLAKAVDGTYNMLIGQTDAAGNFSATAGLTWVRDTLTPSAPDLTHPAANPFSSGDNNLAINGTCEVGATVAMTGSSSASVSCSAVGDFVFNVSKSVDGTYNFSIAQTDRAGNASAFLDFQWVRDTTIPATPLMIIPASDPFYSNSGSLALSVTCDTTAGTLVSLSGDDAQTNIPCTSNPLSLTVNKSSDGTFVFYTTQTDSAGNTSASDSQTWVRDTVSPSLPTITSPSSTPYTAPGNIAISGNCELNARVTLSGDDSQYQECSINGTYGFNVVKSTDATYGFSVIQTDRAGNNSSAASLQWVRNSSSMTAPIVTSPATNPYKSNGSSLTVSGTCTASYTVTLSGVNASEVTTPANSLTQTCSGAGTFSYVIAKSSDGSYGLSFTQTFNSVNSPASSLTWDRNTVAPVVTFTSTPAATNTVTSAAFAFSSSKSGSTFQCKLSGGSYASCTSPVSYTNMTNGAYTFYVIATDSYGNASAESTYSWTQAAYNSMALFHFDTGAVTTDGSHWGNTLTAQGSPATGVTGKFSQAVTLGTNNYYSAPDSLSLSLGTTKMTIEGWYKLTSIPSNANNNTYFTLVSKTAASPNLGWEVQLVRPTKSSGKCGLRFYASGNGTTQPTPITSTTNTSVCTTGTWTYFAVTVSSGAVSFYTGSTSITNRTPGSNQLSGITALFDTNATFKIGADSSTGSGLSEWLAGTVDEIRISNVVRSITTVPSAAFANGE